MMELEAGTLECLLEVSRGRMVIVKVKMATSTWGLEARMVRMVVVSRCEAMKQKEDLMEDSQMVSEG